VSELGSRFPTTFKTVTPTALTALSAEGCYAECGGVLQVKTVGGDQYYRLDDERVVAWLACKVAHIAEHLMAHGDANFQGLGEAGLREWGASIFPFCDGKVANRTLRVWHGAT
jgi:hypothetical protein